MNEAKFRRAMEGMTLIAKRVYDSVPIEELWDPHRIGAEMQRKGSHIDFQILRGCLKTLVDAGVIQEPAKLQFRRTPIRPPAILTSDITDTMVRESKMSPTHAVVATPPTTKRQITPIDVLDELAKRAEKLTEMGKAMEKEAKQLAEDIEEAALALEEQRAAQAEQTELFERMRKVFGNAS